MHPLLFVLNMIKDLHGYHAPGLLPYARTLFICAYSDLTSLGINLNERQPGIGQSFKAGGLDNR